MSIGAKYLALYKIKHLFEINNKKITVQKYSILKVKLKRRKWREELRLFRKLNIYRGLLPGLSKLSYNPWLKMQKPITLDLGKKKIILRISFKSRFKTYGVRSGKGMVYWGRTFFFIFKKFYIENIISSVSHFDLHPVFLHWSRASLIFENNRFRHTKLSKSVSLSESVTTSVIVLKNNKTQPYVTILSKEIWGLKTDGTAYPGVISVLYGARTKKARVASKKKNKAIIRFFNRTAKTLFPKLVQRGSTVSVSVRKKPRCAEIYGHFLTVLTEYYRLKLNLVSYNPHIKHCFVKIRRRPSLKRRLRKSITNRVQNLILERISEERKRSRIVRSKVDNVRCSAITDDI